jgi:N-acylneuraminate cytidylyltransferase/CMP-N,N'-diacetyllegionaminic acid synthase
VSTDDEEIAAVAREAGAEVPFLRPASLAQADTSKWLVFRHLVSMVESQENKTVDILVDLDTGVPLRSVADIDGCINLFLREEVDVVVTAYKAERNPYFNMVEIQPNGYARISKPLQIPIVGRQLAPEVFSLTPSVYVISREALFHYEHWSQARMKIYPVPRERAVDIDEEIDLKFVRFLMESGE